MCLTDHPRRASTRPRRRSGRRSSPWTWPAPS